MDLLQLQHLATVLWNFKYVLESTMQAAHHFNEKNSDQKMTLNFNKFHNFSWQLDDLDIGSNVLLSADAATVVPWAVKIWIC